MIILGITGPTGAGKTTVSKLFEEKGIKVIDTDIVAREIVEPGKPALKELTEYFWNGILLKNGELNRHELARKAFSNPDSHMMLNKITHHYITIEVEKTIEIYDGDIIGIDGAVLIESGISKKCDKVLSVLADKDIRIDRIIKRDSISVEDAELRISSQKNNEFYIENSDYLVYNNGKEDLEKDILKIINELRSMVWRIQKGF